MIWATRLLDVGSEEFIRELFEAQVASLGRPEDMMLISVDEEPSRRRLWIGAPEDDLLSSYYGFVRISRQDLPVAPTLVAGSQRVFQAMFQAGG
jgi:hypothetical protein